MSNRSLINFLQVGDFSLDYYDQALYSALNNSELLNVEKFVWSTYFSDYKYKSFLHKLFYTFENRYKYGFLVRKLNQDLLRKVKDNSYDVIFLWRAVHIYPSTIKALKKQAVVIGYNNDQTYSDSHPWWLFFVLKQSIPYYDHFFVYRSSDIAGIESKGVSSSVFMPTVDFKRIYPVRTEKKYDVVFIGHYENDSRDELIVELIQRGFKVGLYGQRWSDSIYYNRLVESLGEIKPAYNNYNDVLNSSKVCLSFLSKLNNDKYTRRTLEIPASKTVMLAEYTNEQAIMFEPDVEAVYFNNHNEAIEKLYWLMENPAALDAIAHAGYKKVLLGSYQLSDRVNDIIDVAQEKRAKKNEC